jgi:hypothetical protein
MHTSKLKRRKENEKPKKLLSGVVLVGLLIAGVSALPARVKMMKKTLTSLFLCLAVLLVTLTLALHSQYAISNAVTITSIGLEVYEDVNCTQPLSQIEWGFLEPNETAFHVCYVKSVSNINSTLNLTTENWNPANSSNYLTLSWNYENSTLQPNEVLEVTFDLHVNSEVSGIDNFSVDIILYIYYEPTLSTKIGDLNTACKNATLVLGTSEPYGPLPWGALIDDTVGAINLATALGAYGNPDSAFDTEVAEWNGTGFIWKLDSPSSIIAIGGTGVNLVSYEYNSLVHFSLGVTEDCVELEVDADGIDYIRLYFTPSHYVIHYSDSSEVQYDFEENDFAAVYAYYDSVNDKYVFLVMGICAEGTIGACRYLATNLASFPTDVANAQGIILHWQDTNGDGIAKGDEMTVIATYP